jgi:hypothetical protein
MNIKCSFDEEEFEDTKEVIRILISKKDRQHKSQKNIMSLSSCGDRRGRDRMVVRCTTTCTTSAYHHRAKNIQRINDIFVMVPLRMVN